MKTAMLRARIEPQLKVETESILKELGLNVTQAVTVFFRQIVMTRGLPFEVRTPNATTRRAVEDALHRHNLHRVKDTAAMFRDLDS